VLLGNGLEVALFAVKLAVAIVEVMHVWEGKGFSKSCSGREGGKWGWAD
jgi:hypothetical protein